MSRLMKESDGCEHAHTLLTDEVAPEGWGICLVFSTAIEQAFVEIQPLACLRSCYWPKKIFLPGLCPMNHPKRYMTVECYAEALPTGQMMNEMHHMETSANTY